MSQIVDGKEGFLLPPGAQGVWAGNRIAHAYDDTRLQAETLLLATQKN